MNDEIVKPQEELPANTTTDVYQFLALLHQENNVNIHQGLPLPSPEQIHALEQHCPGSVKRVLELFEKQVIHYQELDNKVIDNDFQITNSINNKEHEFFMKELVIENNRLNKVVLLIFVILFLLIITGIIFLAVGNNTAGLACFGLVSVPGFAVLINSVKTRTKS